MREVRNGFVLSTGRELQANRCLVSLREEGGKWQLTEGYDGDLCYEWPLWEGADDDDRKEMPSNSELLEVAVHMIARWARFASALNVSDSASSNMNAKGIHAAAEVAHGGVPVTDKDHL